MKRFIAMILVVTTLMVLALAPMCSAHAESDWEPSDDDSIPMSILKWNMRGVEHVCEGILWVGEHVADGTVWVGEHVADGAVWVGEHVADIACDVGSTVADVACGIGHAASDLASSVGSIAKDGWNSLCDSISSLFD